MYSARILRLPLPNSPPWYELFGSTKVQLLDICTRMSKIYCENPLVYCPLNENDWMNFKVWLRCNRASDIMDWEMPRISKRIIAIWEMSQRPNEEIFYRCNYTTVLYEFNLFSEYFWSVKTRRISEDKADIQPKNRMFSAVMAILKCCTFFQSDCNILHETVLVVWEVM